MQTPPPGGISQNRTANDQIRVALADVEPKPWKNGCGVTRELLLWPKDSAWRIRVSVATISTDSPFSTYEGVTRWFTIVDGGGVELRVDGKPHRLPFGSAPFSFEGGADTFCRLLGGTTLALNVMLRTCDGELVETKNASFRQRSDLTCLFYDASGPYSAIGQPVNERSWILLCRQRELVVEPFLVEDLGAKAHRGWWITVGAHP